MSKTRYRTYSCRDPLGFTPGERAVADLIAAGWDMADIAGHLGISRSNVSSKASRAYSKAGVRDAFELRRMLNGLEPVHSSVQAPPDATADTLPAPRTEAERKTIRDGVEDGSIVIDRQMRFVTRAQFMANPAAALERAAHGPVTVRGEAGDVRMVISAPSGADASTPLERALTAARELVAALEEMRRDESSHSPSCKRTGWPGPACEGLTR